MNTVNDLLQLLRAGFVKQRLPVRIGIGCGALLFTGCLCSICLALVTPSTTSEATAVAGSELDASQPDGAQETDGDPAPTDTPAPSNTLRPTATQAPTRTPRPTLMPSLTPSASATPTPVVFSGSGDAVVDVDKNDDAMIVRITYSGGRNFVAWNYDANGEQIDLLVNSIGSYQGVVPIDFLLGERTARLQVESSGDWTIELLPVTAARVERVPSTFTGAGDDIVILDGADPDLLNIDASASKGNFVIWAYGDDRDLLVNEIAPYTGTVIVGRGVVLFVIKAGGPWTIEITAR